MKNKLLLFVFFLLFIPVNAMSDAVKEEPKIESNKLTQQEIRNVAINFYRENYVPWQIKKGIVTDYEKAIKVENIEFEVDSLVDESNTTIVYIFNFKPTGWMWVGATTSNDPVPTHSEECNYSVKSFYEKKKNPPLVNIDLGIFESIKRRRNINPTIELKQQWEKYKVDPKEFEVKKNFKMKEK